MKTTFLNFRKRLGKWFWLILAVAIIAVWRIMTSGGGAIKVQTVKVAKGDVIESVSTSGTVKADQYVSLTFPSGGKVVYVNVKTGDKVVKGQAIAGIDTVTLNATYQNALNTYRSTQAAVDLEHDNDKNYGGSETFSQKSTRTAAEVANDNAYNNVLAAQENLKNANIYAPFDGIVDTVSPSAPGINLAASAANYTVVNPDSVYFDSEVEETDLPNVAVGQRVNIKLDAYPGDIFTGTVENIGVVAFTSSTGGNAYHVRISLPINDNLKFRVGMQGDTDIIYGTVSDTLKVSSTAVVSEGDKSYVWISKNGRVKKIEVSIGVSSTDEIQIKSGVSEGEEVVDNPPSGLKAGQKIST